jgi:protein gp37
MSDGSKIEWTQATWNWVTGCTRISDGCLNCYIETTPPFRIAHRKFSGPGIGAWTGVKLHSDRLWWPRKWRAPRRIFVNSLADTFHGDVPADLIAEAFAVMAACPRHVFQVLTKRHGRMRALLGDEGFTGQVQDRAENMGVNLDYFRWPLPNVHLGVSVESQQWAEARIPALLKTPAAVRFLSCEPLIGPVDLGIGDPHRGHESDDVFGWPHPRICLDCSDPDGEDNIVFFEREPDPCGLSWVIVGGESGPGARPMSIRWARMLVRECQSAGVPVFVKQLGSVLGKELGAGPKGGSWDAWPEDLRHREFPRVPEAVTS